MALVSPTKLGAVSKPALKECSNDRGKNILSSPSAGLSSPPMKRKPVVSGVRGKVVEKEKEGLEETSSEAAVRALDL